MKCNARPTPESHASDFWDINTKSLWLCSGRRQLIQKRTRLIEKTPAVSACVKVWVQCCWLRYRVMPFWLCWRRVCIMVENGQIEFFCWDKLTKVVSDCSKKCSVGHCINDLFGFHEQTGNSDAAWAIRGRGLLHTWSFVVYLLHVDSRGSTSLLTLARIQPILLK